MEEASTVVNKLKDLTLSTDGAGKSIKAPASRIDELRIQLASEGLRSGKIGFQIFDKTNLDMIEFLRKSVTNEPRRGTGATFFWVCGSELKKQRAKSSRPGFVLATAKNSEMADSSSIGVSKLKRISLRSPTMSPKSSSLSDGH